MTCKWSPGKKLKSKERGELSSVKNEGVGLAVVNEIFTMLRLKW